MISISNGRFASEVEACSGAQLGEAAKGMAPSSWLTNKSTTPDIHFIVHILQAATRLSSYSVANYAETSCALDDALDDALCRTTRTLLKME